MGMLGTVVQQHLAWPQVAWLQDRVLPAAELSWSYITFLVLQASNLSSLVESCMGA